MVGPLIHWTQRPIHPVAGRAAGPAFAYRGWRGGRWASCAQHGTRICRGFDQLQIFEVGDSARALTTTLHTNCNSVASRSYTLVTATWV